MWPLEAAVGSFGSVIVHTVADCWTFPVAVPTQIVVADRYYYSLGKTIPPSVRPMTIMRVLYFTRMWVINPFIEF